MTTEELHAEVLRRWPASRRGKYGRLVLGELSWECVEGEVYVHVQGCPSPGLGATVDEALDDLATEIDMLRNRLLHAQRVVEALNV